VRHTSIALRIALVLCTLAITRAAGASVTLSFSPTSTQVSPGGTITLNLSLTSTAEHTVGLDYFLRAASNTGGSATGLFTITGRTIPANSPYSDPTSTNIAVLDPNSANLKLTRGTFTNSNGSDLGATASAEQVAGIFPVATYTLSISPSAPIGSSYTISTYSDPGSGYSAGSDQNFGVFPFTSQASATVTVVPEPAGIGLCVIALGALAARGSRRRRAADLA
jgi:hypothetical protein